MYLLVAQLDQRCHGESDIIEIVEGPTQLLGERGDELEEVHHCGAVFGVGATPVQHHPAFDLGDDAQLDLFCYCFVREMELMEILKSKHKFSFRTNPLEV